jgi:hypothetical protein
MRFCLVHDEGSCYDNEFYFFVLGEAHHYYSW